MQKYATAQSPRPDIIRKWFNFVRTAPQPAPRQKRFSFATFLRSSVTNSFRLLSLIEKGEDNQRLTIQNKKKQCRQENSCQHCYNNIHERGDA